MFKLLGDNFSKFQLEDFNYYIKGYLLKGAHLMSKVEIHDHFQHIKSLNNFNEQLQVLNGCFCIVIQTSDKVYFSTDVIRSYPLFFTINKTNLYMSDNTNSLLDILNKKEINSLAREEFISVKSTPLNYTLIDEIKQVDNGQSFEFSIKSKTIRSNYYIYNIHANSCKIDFNLFEKILLNTFNRLIDSVNNKTIVVPLSGGYDSRLIVTMLKKLNYSNVVCFSYGKSDSYEAKTSSKVASKLNFDWHFISFEDSHMKDFLKQNILEEYMLYSGNLSSVPHFQDLYAVHYLKENNLIDSDSIFVPGHSGDLLAGSHITEIFNKISTKRFKKNSTISSKIHQHWYRLNFFSNQKDIDNKKSIQRIQTFLKHFPSIDNELIKTDVWDISNRQAKFIVNSVRVYEFYGYDFRLPLWDIDYTKFCLRALVDQRINCNFYNRTLENIIFKEYDIVYKKESVLIKSIVIKLARKFLNERIIGFLRFKKNKSYVDFNNEDLIINYIQQKTEIESTSGFLSIDDWSCVYYLKLLDIKYGINSN